MSGEGGDQEVSGLEKMMAGILSESKDITEGVKVAEASAKKTRRKSKELTNGIAEFQDSTGLVVSQFKLVMLLGDDKSDEAITKLFETIDTNQNNSMEPEELREELRRVNKRRADEGGSPLSDDVLSAQVDEVYKDAVLSGLAETKEKITKQEFVKIMNKQKEHKAPRKRSKELEELLTQ